MPRKRAHETSNASRPIITKFSFFQQKRADLHAGTWEISKAQIFAWQTIIPKWEIDDTRKAVYPVYKNARKKNVRATLPVDRPIKQGSVYRGEETKKLPLYATILHPTEWSFWLSANNSVPVRNTNWFPLKVSPWKAVLAIRSKYSMSVCFI